MIKKTRTKPLKLLKFEVLLERILPNHTQKQLIETNYRKYLAGFRGELTLDLQKKHLFNWLYRHKFPLIPIHTLVVITNPKSYIRISPKYGLNAQKIIRGRTLPNKIKEIEKLESEVILQKRDIKRISSLLLKEHTSHNPDILKLFSIHRNEILTGVLCPNCTQIVLIRINRNWLCTRCSKTYMDAHKKAIIDYALLFSPVVKNKDLRSFLHMQSQSSVKKTPL